MPKPTASGGSAKRPVNRKTSSTPTASAPTTAPIAMRCQSICPLMTPLASAEMSVACGAGSGCATVAWRFGAPAKPYARLSKSSIGGMTSAPITTPITSATCWRHGVASTSCPVLRSCRLSFEIVATQSSTAVTKSAYATSCVAPDRPLLFAIASTSKEAPNTAKIASPETGLFDDPIRPAI